MADMGFFQGVTIPSQRRYVRYWGQVCGRISPTAAVTPVSTSGSFPMDDIRRLTDVLIDRENKARLQEIGAHCSQEHTHTHINTQALTATPNYIHAGMVGQW